MADLIIEMQEGDAEEAAGALIPVNEGNVPYRAKIETCELVSVANGNNKGKPMYKLRVRLLDGPGKGRAMFGNACLWYEARFTIVQIMAALDFPIEKKLKVPSADKLINKELGVIVKHGLNQYDEQRHEISRFTKLGGASAASNGADTKKGQRVSF